MRDGFSGRYTIRKNGGYQVCMLDHSVMRSYYYDPYLLAVVTQSKRNTDSIANQRWPRCFYGYETEPRGLKLKSSAIQIQCVDKGWQMSEVPTDPLQNEGFNQLRSTLGISSDLLCTLPQSDGIDTKDRVEQGAQLLIVLVNAGL